MIGLVESRQSGVADMQRLVLHAYLAGGAVIAYA